MAMRPLRASDLAELAELAQSPDVASFESGVLELLRRHVGFDVALFRRKRDYGAVTVGFDPALLRAAAPLWPRIVQEAHAVAERARASDGVITDREAYGREGFRRTTAYRHLAQPAGGILGVSLLSHWRSRWVAHLLLGRARRGFGARELERLRAFMPSIRLAESLRYVQSKCAGLDAAEGNAQSALSRREREVVSYLSLGYTNEQIAAACGSSLYTVRNQLSHAYAKLGVASRAEAVAVLARRSG